MKEKDSPETPFPSVPKVQNKLQPAGNRLKRHLHVIILGIVLIIAALIRLWAAPTSAGPDVAQFWAFAKVFQQHGLDFYRYADAQLDIFPMKGWAYVYPPIWLLISKICLFFAPSSTAYSIAGTVTVSPAWRLAVKIPIIAADLAIGLLLYWGVPGSKNRKLLFATLWLLHPTAWFESGVFGQFDAIAAAFLLTAIIFLLKGKDRLAFLFAGLAIMTKQHTLIAVGMMVIVCKQSMSWRRLLTNCAVTAGVVAAISLPFLVTGNFYAYLHAIVLPGQGSGYQSPLCFCFSGPGALLTYLHNVFGWDTTTWISFTVPLMIVCLGATAILCYFRRITPLQGALAGFLVFISLSYQVNYQYLIVYIPLALLLASRTQFKLERIFALVIAILPAVWVWLDDVPWWFHNMSPDFFWPNRILAHIGLPDRYLPDWTYVAFACLLMCTGLAYAVLAFTRWSKPPDIKADG
jgi:Glycosyltransferase family 87